MGITRIEQAIDEVEPLGDELEPSCDDIRLAWLAHELSSVGATGADFDAIWTDR